MLICALSNTTAVTKTLNSSTVQDRQRKKEFNGLFFVLFSLDVRMHFCFIDLSEILSCCFLFCSSLHFYKAIFAAKWEKLNAIQAVPIVEFHVFLIG